MAWITIETPDGSELAVQLAEPSTGSGEAETGTAEVEDGRRRGAVLYLHGFGSDQEGEKATYFRRRALAAGLTVCSLDFRGHGRSGGGMRGLTLSRCLEDAALVDDLLRERGYGPAVVLGSSMGAYVGLWHAARRPERVAAGLFIAPAVAMAESFRRFVGAEGEERWRRDGSMRFADERMEADLGYGFITDLESYPVEQLAGRLAAPSLLLMGVEDDRVPWRRVAELAGAAAGTPLELHLFADGDHRLVDRLDRLWGLMAEFLRGRGLLE